jgi:RNA polymerase sigma factor (sigma-70 family)
MNSALRHVHDVHVGVFDTAFLSSVSIPGQITILYFVKIGMSSVIEACIPVSQASRADGAYDPPFAASAAEASVSLWMGRLAEGDPAAAEKIWQRYYERLVRFARHKLAGANRRASDEEDLAQSVFGSFFQAATAGRFPKLNDRDALWRLLLVITSRKAASRARRDLALKRAGEVGESALLPAGMLGVGGGIDQVLGTTPSPEFAALAEEQCQRLLEVLGDEMLRRIAKLRLEGYTVDEISAQLGRAPGTIHRKLARIREIWQEHAET